MEAGPLLSSTEVGVPWKGSDLRNCGLLQLKKVEQGEEEVVFIRGVKTNEDSPNEG